MRGTDRIDSALEAVARHLASRFHFDARGRIEALAGEGGDPPRFCFARTAEGAVWRFRSDLPDEQVRLLARYAGKEAPFPAEGPLPERQESLLRLLWPVASRPDSVVRRYRVAWDGEVMQGSGGEAAGDVFDYV